MGKYDFVGITLDCIIVDLGCIVKMSDNRLFSVKMGRGEGRDLGN